MWNALRRGGRWLQQDLVGVLPARLGRHAETVDALLTLPWLVNESVPSPEVADLRCRIHANPEAFSPLLREVLGACDGSNGDIATG